MLISQAYCFLERRDLVVNIAVVTGQRKTATNRQAKDYQVLKSNAHFGLFVVASHMQQQCI